MTEVQQLLGGFVMLAILYYVFAPWWVLGKPGWQVKWRHPFENRKSK